MYKLLTPLRSLARHLSGYVIFALLLILLLILNLTVTVLGSAATAESEKIVEKYAASFLCFDLNQPHKQLGQPGDDPYFEEIVSTLPHVRTIKLLAMHTLNSALGQRMIGAPAEVLDCVPLEGRLYQSDGECCINESYARYLADSVGFTGVGDTILLYDDENALQYTVYVDENNERAYRFYEHDKSAEFTVVGILRDDATPFHKTLHFGTHRIYTTTAAVEEYFQGVGTRKANGANDSYYLPGLLFTQDILAGAGWGRPSDDGTHWLFLDRFTLESFDLCSAEISLAQYPPNEGYMALVTIDDPANEADFLNAARGTFVRIGEPAASDLKYERKDSKNIFYYSIDGREEEWYSVTSVPCVWYAARLVDDPSVLTETLAPVSPLCDAIGRAASAASAVLILLMTILVVHERRYEIGVLRCIGVSARGVCARFIAEISVFLAIVSASGVALGIPAAHLAAKLLGVADSISGVLPAALLLLAGIAAVTLLSCLAASAMILAKKPMHILNSRT
ncbi:MAG: ABC transporter permease [Eubacteriales bacterium]